MINWECCRCQAAMEAPESLRGEPLDCPECGTSQKVPSAINGRVIDDLDNYETQIGDYHLRVKRRRLYVDGPDDSIARAIADDWLAAPPAEELLTIVIPGAREQILARALSFFHYRGLNGDATEGQLRYARELGLTYPQNPSKAYIGRILSQFEQVRFYVCFVWRSMMHKAPAESGVPKGMIDRFVVDILRNNKPLYISMFLTDSMTKCEEWELAEKYCVVSRNEQSVKNGYCACHPN